MLLYHASTQAVDHPKIINRSPYLDFGPGFYTTSNLEQAEDFARKAFVRRGMQGAPTLNVYDFDEGQARETLAILEFEQPDRMWLDFVVNNRRNGRPDDFRYDIVVGPVANDDVFTTVVLYEHRQITADAALEMLKIKRLFTQTLFCNETALQTLAFVDAREVER